MWVAEYPNGGRMREREYVTANNYNTRHLPLRGRGNKSTSEGAKEAVEHVGYDSI